MQEGQAIHAMRGLELGVGAGIETVPETRPLPPIAAQPGKRRGEECAATRRTQFRGSLSSKHKSASAEVVVAAEGLNYPRRRHRRGPSPGQLREAHAAPV